MAFKKKRAKKGPFCQTFKEQMVSLSLLKRGQRGVISSIKLQDPASLQRLTSLGLLPGTPFVVERSLPLLSLRLPYSHLFIDKELAEKIYVRLK